MALLQGAARLVEDRRASVGAHRRPPRPRPARRRAPTTPPSCAQAASRSTCRSRSRRTDVAALARAEGRSIEDAGREARYRFLEEVAPAGALIATAHTADDAAETVLLNLLRGSGLAGVRGIPARRGRIVRPLLGERRSDAPRRCSTRPASRYRVDPSNDDPAYLRNRVRGELLPLLEALRPGAVDRIGQFARLAADDDALLDELAAAELARRRTRRWRDRLARPAGPALGRRVLRLAIGEPAPSAERIEALLEAAAGDRGGVPIELGGGRVGIGPPSGVIRIALSRSVTLARMEGEARATDAGCLFAPIGRTYTCRARDVQSRAGAGRQAGRRSHGGESRPTLTSRIVRNSVVLVVLAVFGLAVLWTFMGSGDQTAERTSTAS